MPDFARVLTVTGGRVADLTDTFVGYKCPIKFSHKKYKTRKLQKSLPYCASENIRQRHGRSMTSELGCILAWIGHQYLSLQLD